MAPMARVVAPGMPHSVTQRGNRHQETFFSDEHYQRYLEVMAQWYSLCAVAVWADCLMTNHVDLIVVLESKEAMTRAIGEAHRRYTRGVNFRQGWRGHL
jgi:putative transposase